MIQVKFNNEKWWVLHQENWIEIDQKYWEKVKEVIFHARANTGLTNWRKYLKDWQPTPDQIYPLPNEVEFEINSDKIFCEEESEVIDYTLCRVKFNGDCHCERVKVAHLNNSEPKKDERQTVKIDKFLRDMKIDSKTKITFALLIELLDEFSKL